LERHGKRLKRRKRAQFRAQSHLPRSHWKSRNEENTKNIKQMRERGFEPLRCNPLDPKGKKCRNRYPLKAHKIPCNPFIINGFPVFPASVGIGEKRSYPERRRHKIDIKKCMLGNGLKVQRAWASPAGQTGSPHRPVMFHVTPLGWDSRIMPSQVGIRHSSPLGSRATRLTSIVTCPALASFFHIQLRPRSEVTIRPVSEG
jgi:hypothetical protein